MTRNRALVIDNGTNTEPWPLPLIARPPAFYFLPPAVR